MTVDLPPTWRPLPDELLFDRAVPDSAIRLYALLHWCRWKRRDISDLADLVSLYPVPDGTKPPGRSTIYRWIYALEASGWITFTRQQGQKGFGARFTLHSKPVPPAGKVDETCPAGGTSLGQPVPPAGKGFPTSGKSSSEIPRPNAVKNAPQTPDQISGSDPDPTTPQTPTPSAGGGGGERSAVTARPAEQPWTQTPRTEPEAVDPDATHPTRTPRRANEPNAATAEPNRPSPLSLIHI